MFGSFLPSLGCLAAIKSTQVEGANIVMKSSGLAVTSRLIGSNLSQAGFGPTSGSPSTRPESRWNQESKPSGDFAESRLSASRRILRTTSSRVIAMRSRAFSRVTIQSHPAGSYTWSTSPSRATIWYNTGLTKNPMKSREINPATITMAKGF